MNNDLISRSALKKAFEETVCIEPMPYAFVKQIIDNATTVEAYPFEQVQELVKLNQQFAQQIENLKRPQGEWIKEPNGKTTDVYRCSVCNRSIMLCKGADLTNYPFCHCGADMRGAE